MTRVPTGQAAQVETNGIYEMVRNYIKNVDNCRISAEAPLE
jgi:hypothetical protein